MTYGFRRHPSLCPRIPPRDQETESMSGTKQNTANKRPLFALYPSIVFDEVGVRPEWVERKERGGVEVRPERQRYSERCRGNFRRINVHGRPVDYKFIVNIRLVRTRETGRRVKSICCGHVHDGGAGGHLKAQRR